MTDNITLPRAVVEKLVERLYARLKRIDCELWGDDLDALDAAAAALAEPPAKREPATEKQVGDAHGQRGRNFYGELKEIWSAAERHHGIRKEDGK
jgi:hypothetical protein